MGMVSAFWSGAQACSTRLDLPRLAEAVGGWSRLSKEGPGVLQDVGVTPAMVHRWRSGVPTTSVGEPLTLADPRYPCRLAALPNPPAFLLVAGDPRILNEPCVAIVGARRCTGYGVALARRLGHALASAGWTVVSGLARGIDASAHRGALDGGRTAAVLAHGLSHTAPPSNRRLRARIERESGCLVTTHPDAVEPRPRHFPLRNRWIAGLADIVIVVEAARRSGTMHTVRAAMEFGRDVYAVPGPVGAPASEGCLALIADGAGVLIDVDEFVASLGSRRRSARSWVDDVVDGLPLDEVARRAGRSMTEILEGLGRLELEGRLVRLPGRRYTWSGRPT